MEEGNYIPIVYILIYRDIKSNALNNIIDLGKIKLVLSHFHIKKDYHHVVIKELIKYNFIKHFNGRSSESIEVNQIKQSNILQNTSKMYRYVGCY